MSNETLKRAFELANSGRCTNITDICRMLARERCDSIDAHLSGTGLKKRLLTRIEKAKVAGVGVIEA
ncbi:MAG: hypothetical protein EOO77_29435 [Oxalobacteraceae bacterium]|nr:MAG: hypothetical protein EOO77_29435 [Oxalobacteraceae bacterium]